MNPIKTQGNFMAFGPEGECIAAFALEKDRTLFKAAPALLKACEQIVWKLSHNHDLPDYKGPARITRNDATVRMAIAAIKEAQP